MMNLNEYQRSRSFIDLGPRSLRFNIFKKKKKILETAWPIEAKFYVEPPLDGGTKVLSNCLGHMTYKVKLKTSSSLKPKDR